MTFECGTFSHRRGESGQATGPGGPLQNKPLVESISVTPSAIPSFRLDYRPTRAFGRARQLLESADVREVKLPACRSSGSIQPRWQDNQYRPSQACRQGLEKVHGTTRKRCWTASTISRSVPRRQQVRKCKHIFEDLCRLRSARYCSWMTLETELGLAGVNGRFPCSGKLFQKALRVGRSVKTNVIKFVLQGLAEIRFEQGDYESATRCSKNPMKMR